MKILQFTDIHLTAPGQTIGGRDPNANFEKALAHALSFHADAEALIITGDLSDWGERGDYERLKARLESVPLPVGLCIGNHDDRPIMGEVFPELLNEDGHMQRSMLLSRGSAILLDTWGPETHAGHFCETRAAWLDRALYEAEGPVQIFLHHNPIPTHIGPVDQIMLLDHERLGEIVSRHREKIGHIHFGHCHLPLMGTFWGAPISGIRGTNHAGWASFDEEEILCGAELPESYAVIMSSDHAITKVMVEYGYEGEIVSGGKPDYATWSKDAPR